MELPQPPPDTRPEPSWRELFTGSPREILERLIDDDPLDLARRCRERLLRQALLMDTQRLHLRTVAHVARDAPAYRGEPAFDVWVADKIRRALKELASEDHAGGEEPLAKVGIDPVLAGIAQLIGMEPLAFQRCCVAFNRAPSDVRTAFFGLVVERKSPAEWAAANGVSVEHAKTLLRRALWTLGVRESIDLDALLEEDGDEH